jgi:hypothetical protein
VVAAVGIGLFFIRKRKGAVTEKSEETPDMGLSGKPELAGDSTAAPYQAGSGPVPEGDTSTGSSVARELDGYKVAPAGVSELTTTPPHIEQAHLPSELPPQTQAYELDGTHWPGVHGQQP